MTKQEQILEIARFFKKSYGRCDNFSGCTNRKCSQCYAEAIYNAGYQKVDEVRKETAKEIIDMLIPNCEVCDENWHKGCLCLRATIAEKIAKQYGVEGDE